ncbi:hypothetical protein [Pseudomonas palleroniana]
MAIGTVSASNPVTINGQSSTQSQPQAKESQAATTATAAINIAAALKEATETAAQTAQEAGHGDHQAQRLMQKHHDQLASTPAPRSGVVNGNGQITGELINTKA